MIPTIILILSFILDGVLSLIFPLYTNLFISTFSLLSLIFIYPFIKENKNYIIISFIFGLIYDITYTNTILLNGFIFLLMSFIIIKLYKIFTMNIFNMIIISICLIILYRTMTYLFLLVVSNNSFDIKNLFESIYSSLILNVIYIIFNYYVLTRKRFKKTFKNNKI